MNRAEPAWHPEALEEAEDARAWYAERSAAAAHSFLVALNGAIEAILEAPERWPEGRHGCRRHTFSNRFPFTVIYRLRTGIEIVAVAHQKRRPDYWALR